LQRSIRLRPPDVTAHHMFDAILDRRHASAVSCKHHACGKQTDGYPSQTRIEDLSLAAPAG